MTTELKEKCFLFLEDLRKSGTTNMYGAVPYLRTAFKLNKDDAASVLLEWMTRYEELSKQYDWR